MNPWLLTLVFPALAVLHGWRTLRGARESLAPVPLQFSLVELMLISFGIAVWFGVDPLDENVILAVSRVIISFCAMLAVKDAAPLDALPRRALLYIFVGLAFAVTGGMAMIFWWGYLLLKKSDEQRSLAGARVAAGAAGLYLIAFFLPLEYPSQTNLWGYGCYVGALTQGIEQMLWGIGALNDQYVEGGMEIYQSVWSANVLLWIGWIYLARARFVAAFCVSLCAFALAVQFYYSGDMEFEFFPAYHLWIFSMLLTAVLALVVAVRGRARG